MGPLSFRFTGLCTFRSSATDGTFAMDFSFNSTKVAAFGWESVKERQPKPKTYSFFLIDQEGGVAAVTSSATGGKTLMCRVQS